MELPKYIQLDFLLVILGVVPIGFSLWVIFYQEISFEKIFYLSLIVIAGSIVFVVGISEMFKNYDKQRELRDVEITRDKLSALWEIKKLEKKLKIDLQKRNK